MPYIRHSAAIQISPDTVETLGRIAGLTLPPEDLGPLAEAFADHLASIALLDDLDLTGVDPVLDFDPRWHERDAS